MLMVLSELKSAKPSYSAFNTKLTVKMISWMFTRESPLISPETSSVHSRLVKYWDDDEGVSSKYSQEKSSQTDPCFQ